MPHTICTLNNVWITEWDLPSFTASWEVAFLTGAWNSTHPLEDSNTCSLFVAYDLFDINRQVSYVGEPYDVCYNTRYFSIGETGAGYHSTLTARSSQPMTTAKPTLVVGASHVSGCPKCKQYRRDLKTWMRQHCFELSCKGE